MILAWLRTLAFVQILLVSFSVFVSGLVAPSLAVAGTMASVGTTMSYSLDTSGRNYEANTPFSLRGGYRFSLADLYGEVSFFSSKSSGTEMVGVSSRDLEFLFWGRKSFSLSRSFALFGALGFGGHQETVKTRYAGDTYLDEGRIEAVGAVASGVQWRLTKAIEASLEGRVSAAESYAPNPRFGLGAFIGFAL